MRILVIGGTRFIGPVTVMSLLDGGHETAVFNRGQSDSAPPDSVRRFTGDRADTTSLRSAVDEFGPEAILDLCAYFERDWTALEPVLDGFGGRYVLVSSCDVYRNYGGLIGLEEGDPDLVPLLESSPLRSALYPYKDNDKVKAGFEDYDKIPLERATLKSGGIVVRLPMVYGPWDTQHRVGQYLSRMDAGRPILLGKLEAEWKTCRAHVRQVARALTLVLENGENSQTFNVAESPALTELQWVTAIAEAAGYQGRTLLVDDGAVSEIPGHIERPSWHLAISSDKVRNELGFEEDQSMQEGLLATVQWERANPGAIDQAVLDAEDRVLAQVT